MIMLLIAAIGALAAGVLAILYGIPVKEFSFGNTMVLSGVIGICTGFILFGLWVSTREMRALARQIAAPASSGLHDPSLPELNAAPQRPVRPMARESVATAIPPAEPEPPVFPPFAQTEIEDRGPPPDMTPTVVAEPTPQPKPRRNLLFESSVRQDRERAAASAAPPIEANKSATLDDPIAQRGADRAERLQRARSPSTFSEPTRSSAQPNVTVLKSGVVDGMSYSLYSDGSIEAQMPEGMMRFGSIDELRSHLDQRGA